LISPRAIFVARLITAQKCLHSRATVDAVEAIHALSEAAATATVSLCYDCVYNLLTHFAGQCGYRPEHCSQSGPKQCVADCDAKAPCGEFSADGKTSCPLNVCCSHMGFCGTSDLFCDDMSTMGDGSPCLGDNCSPVVAPSCGKGSGTASRRVAYYQSWYVKQALL
jgi:hypothetical protein